MTDRERVREDLFDWNHLPSWAQEGGEHFDGHWVPDCGGKMDYDPALLRFSCRVWRDGAYICSAYFGADTRLENTGVLSADSASEARAAVETWCKERARHYLAAAMPRPVGEVTEAMIEAARKAVRYQLPEVEARRIYLAMQQASVPDDYCGINQVDEKDFTPDAAGRATAWLYAREMGEDFDQLTPVEQEQWRARGRSLAAALAVPDDGGEVERVARDYQDAVEALFERDPETGDLYVEGSPTTSKEVFDRFVRFNDTGKALDAALAAGEVERLRQQAREIEGDSDNPLRVAAANKLYDQAAALASRQGSGR